MLYTWLLIVVLLVILEIMTTNLVSIWFVISGLLAMVISLFTDSLYIQIGVFVLVGVLLIPMSKRIYKKINTKKVCTNLDRVIGMKGIATSDILKNTIGEVKVGGKLWSSYSSHDIKKDEYVKVLAIDGVKLKVEKWED